MILVVDDEKMVREMVSQVLSTRGYECRTAVNGREALSILDEGSFSIAVVDIVMPGMDGIELLKEIKARYPQTDTIIMTAYSKDYNFIDVVKHGASDFISKPFSNDELEAKVNRVFRERELRTEILTSRNKLKSIFDGIKDGIYVIDRDYHILSVNKALADKMDVSFADMIGKHCYEIFYKRNTPCEGDGFVCPGKTSFAEGMPIKTIRKLNSVKGETCYFEVEATPISSNNQKASQAILICRNVTDRALAEELLKKNEDRLRTILDTVQTGIVIIDPENHKIVYANKVAVNMIGTTRENITGSVCHRYICPAEVGKCPITDLGQTVEEDADRILITADGREIPILKSVGTVMLDDRKHLVESFLDISERKKQREDLIRTKEFMDNIIDNSMDMIVIGDATGNFVRVNKAFLKKTGYQREEVIGKHIMEFSAMKEGTYESTAGETIEVDKELNETSYKMIAELLDKGGVSCWQNYYIRKDKKIIPTETSVIMLYDKEGNITGSVGICRDITDRRKSEIEKTRLLNETKEALEELKKTQSYLLQSEKMASVGQLAAGVAHEINNPTGFVHSNLGSLNKYSMRLLELIRKYEEGMDELKNNGHKEITSFCKEIEALKKKLKIDVIMNDFQKVITDSLEGTERIKKIVADLKNFSHVDQAEFKYADITEGIESTLNVVWNELKYKCTVEKDYGDLPKLYCNLGQLNQVFANLLVNAAHAIEEEGVIRIATRYVNGKSRDNDDGRGHVEVTINDTGCGIPEDKLGRIFEPFFTTKDVGKGTGLGLSIAYDIIRKTHNGEIGVESEVGKGTTFTIKLPLMPNGDKNG
ncbi:MAG: PAS domain S-box protein [Syntrophaceae bacterium]|nr:PAS domain S-box protein [Syntrophaceae bacterium]